MRRWVIDDFGRGHSRIDILPKPVPNPNAALEHLDRGPFGKIVVTIN
jgi:hypothetical protein